MLALSDRSSAPVVAFCSDRKAVMLTARTMPSSMIVTMSSVTDVPV